MEELFELKKGEKLNYGTVDFYGEQGGEAVRIGRGADSLHSRIGRGADPETGLRLRSDGCLVLRFRGGCGIVSVDFRRMPVRSGDVVTVFPDAILALVKCSRGLSADYVSLDADFADEVTRLSSPEFFDRIYDCPIFTPDAQDSLIIENWWRQFVWICEKAGENERDNLLHWALSGFFLGLESKAKSVPVSVHSEFSPSARALFIRFCRLLTEHCIKEHEVSFYADKLCVSTHYLYRVSMMFMNCSPKDVIDRQIVLELKHIMSSTDLSIKEIADMFNFTPYYLSRYFHKHTGLTPTAFRQG